MVESAGKRVWGVVSMGLKCAINVELVGDSFSKLRGDLAGPPDTPYEGGRYVVDISVPETYPFNPPKVKFLTKIWHPNISSVTGAICLDVLKDQWAAAMTLRTVLLSIQMLLASPEPDDPQDAVVARQCKENPEIFRRTARHWAQAYANAPGNIYDCEQKIRNLQEMGFDENKSRVALSTHNWNVERAVESVFNS
ncbi:ubiquitin-conjugating enzyme E2-22 kDa-like isoform X2 [Dendronephthya gigantea]|uniref:ubiquitin-conjugating enzyme E2-22 kDa-like isoform X2 n=1 Tax=Dendronephthya gigantea TaxID=151771 RepID=UPI00106AD08C|nr:ubiquitin-conjugating enzyme E2-22 kDa-like isoform X2 [Dendronephthya gigantea]